jgi:hypothetical protein
LFHSSESIGAKTQFSLVFLETDGRSVSAAEVGSPPARYYEVEQLISSDLNFVGGWTSNETDNVRKVVFGDMDGDSDLDFVVVNDNILAPTVRVYHNLGNGNFNLEWESADTDKATRSVALGDMDGDGDLDLALANDGFLNQIYRNDNHNEFTLAWESTGDVKFTRSVAWGDVDADGDLDLAFGNDGQVNQLYQNNGNANFELLWESTGQSKRTWSIAFGDMDGDDYLDLAVGNWQEANQVYHNDGEANLSLVWESAGDTKPTSSIAWGEMNGDGGLDLVVGNDVSQVNQIYQNEGGGNFSLSWESTGDEYDTREIALGDVDADGDIDLVVGNFDQVNQIYRNNGNFNFSLDWISTEDIFRTRSITLGDIDADSDLDLVVGNRNQVTQIYLNEKGIGLQEIWESAGDTKETQAIALGDMDGDGDLDLVFGNQDQVNQVYRNEGGNNFNLVWESTGVVSNTRSVAWGDMDSDGDLDLAVGNQHQGNEVYRNQGNGIFELAWESNDTKETWILAWGDMDGDSDLDLAMGNPGDVNQVYRNEGNGIFELAWESIDDTNNTMGLAWGDVDGDGDLDLVFGNQNQVNQVYQNDGNGGFSLSWESVGETNNTKATALGDMDGDGDLDLTFANFNEANQVYQNEGNNSFNLTWTTTGDVKSTRALAWGDSDGDGDLDLAFVNHGNGKQVYQNTDNGDFSLAWELLDGTMDAMSLAWGDVDGDGDLDLAIGNHGQANQVFVNRHQGEEGLANNPPWMSIVHPDKSANANFYATSTILQGPTIPITYTLFDTESDPIGRVTAFYSLNGGGQWFEAIASSDTITTNLSTSPNGVSHNYEWDTFASGFFGQSDNVVLRFVADSQLPTGVSVGTYHYINSTPGPFQRPYASATTFPFRVRGTQVRVYTETIANGNELPGTIVYRLSAGQNSGAQLIAGSGGQPYVTDNNGYLQGRGALNVGDRLVAMLPITETYQSVLYHTSAAPTINGLQPYTVTASGVQTLTVSADNPLILFNLLVSLEWDARQDADFLTQLESDLHRASEILYDITNGQAALGKVRVFHDRGYWGYANLIITANNSQRPSALLGGGVLTPTAELSATQPIPDAYIPGQIRMGPTWNRFGDPNGTIGEDWPRTLAHELGHYFFFHPDNYLGLNQEGRLIVLDCPGSIMSNPYDYSEFLTENEWTGSCLNTLAEHYLGRSDWGTIHQFYPGLNHDTVNRGPNSLPLGVTQIETLAPVTPTTTLADPFFNLLDENGEPAPIPQGQAQAYLIKTGDNDDSTDDYVIAQGTPIGNLVQARGVAPGDRLCVYDISQSPLRLGCLNTVGNTAAPITLAEVPDWEPNIQVTPISTTTVAVTVTNVSDGALSVQLLPVLGTASAEMTMDDEGGGVFSQILTAPDGAYYGHVRVWVPGSDPHKEMMVDFMGIQDWGGQALGWGGQALAWGGQALGWGGQALGWGGQALAWGGQALAWGAPVMSGDGQVSVFPIDDLFSSNQHFTLQKLPLPPSLPSWLIPVGQAYRLEIEGETPDSDILFRYMGRDVPAGHESGLSIYYSADDGQNWQRLETTLDPLRNQASTQVQGEGIYVLISTIEVTPHFEQGWNNFGYPVQETRPITEALAAIDGIYTAVANYDPDLTPPWRTYYVTVTQPFQNLVNTLTELKYPRAYWLYATQPITLYLAPRNGLDQMQVEVPASDGLQLPPATFYGWVTPTVDFVPTAGISVTGWIGNELCGTSTIQEVSGRLAYVLSVGSEDITNPSSGCGREGEMVQFMVGEWMMDNAHIWDNSAAWFHSLDTPVIPVEGVMAFNDGPTPLGNTSVLSAEVSSGSGISYTWAFGDGAHGEGEVIDHIYADVGIYTAVVTASNRVNTITATTTVIVEEAITGLTAVNNSPTLVGQTSTLTATIGAGSDVTYHWNLGDGKTAVGAVVTHQYNEAGVYTATVTVENRVSRSTEETSVYVIIPDYTIYLPVARRP